MTAIPPRTPGQGIRDYSGGLANWKGLLQGGAAKGRLVVPMFFGSSLASGMYSRPYENASWPALLVRCLQLVYGDGGSGFRSPGDLASAPYGGDWVASGAGGNLAGGWDISAVATNECVAFAHVGGSGVTLTKRFRGTTLDIIWQPTTTASTTFQYAIDGGANTQVSTTVGAVTGLGITTVTGLAPGTHTVVITANGAQALIVGITGRNATGVMPIYYTKPGRSSAGIGVSPAFGAFAMTEQPYAVTSATVGGQAIHGLPQQTNAALSVWPQIPDLVIHSDDQVNDWNFAFLTPDQTAANLAYLCDVARAYNPAADLVLVAPPRGKLDDREFGAARTDGATTISTPTVTSATGGFNANFLGAVISGTNIPAGSTIIGINSATSITISANATATGSGITLTIMKGASGSSSVTGAGGLNARFTAAVDNIAMNFNGLFVNLGGIWRNSYNYLAGYNYWGNNVLADGSPGTDSIHGSNIGHWMIADVLLPLLSDIQPSVLDAIAGFTRT